MVYSCGNCRFAFERVSEPERCPDCGSLAIHPADEAERRDYEAVRRSLEAEAAGRETA